MNYSCNESSVKQKVLNKTLLLQAILLTNGGRANVLKITYTIKFLCLLQGDIIDKLS